MRRTWRNLFYFSKADRRAVLLLAGVLMGIVLSTSFFLWFDCRTPAKEDSGDSLVYERFFAGLKPDTVVVVRSGPTYGQPVKAKPATFFFDPNTADSTALLRLGLSPWQVRNIYIIAKTKCAFFQNEMCIFCVFFAVSQLVLNGLLNGF